MRTKTETNSLISMANSDYINCVEKINNKWCPKSIFGNFPLYKTKKEALRALDNLIDSLVLSSREDSQ